MYIASKERKRISDEVEVMHIQTKARVSRNKLSPKQQTYGLLYKPGSSSNNKREMESNLVTSNNIYGCTHAQPSQMSDRKGVKTIFTLDMCSVNVVMIVCSCVELAKEEREKKNTILISEWLPF